MKKSFLNENSYKLANYLYENASYRISSPLLFEREWRFFLSTKEIDALNEAYQKFLFCEPLLEHSFGSVSRMVLWESFLMKELLGTVGSVAKGAWNKVKKAAGWVGAKVDKKLGDAEAAVRSWKKEIIKKRAQKGSDDEEDDTQAGSKRLQKKSSQIDDDSNDESKEELSDDELKQKASEKLKELSAGSHSREAEKLLPVAIAALKKKNRISYTLSSDYNKDVKLDHPSLEKMLVGISDKSKAVPMKYAILSLLRIGAVKENQEK